MNTSPAPSQWRILDMLPAIALLLTGLTALAYAMLLPKGETGQFGVLLQPWADASRVIELVSDSHAQILSFNKRTNIVVVYADRPDAIEALYRAGAWFVFEPAQLSSCFDLKVVGP
ncbi:hypothetical protein KUG47_08520 [Falsochrobactrum sp. TDYN1]|uniref:Uncharacterized protein n=1 Tax=Falsochrobactrum tianjinense TaxID=2706015 RepID=A0A949PRG7_9HYPH|nr:hypothetical protein [Falsochrobactrum sp. TDYN1]MBV2143540.1 hypothetical protein [Falsochrobactrum sp. TDYN1]